MIQIDAKLVLAAIVATVGFVTALWHAALHIGRLSIRLDRSEDRLDNHETVIKELVGERRSHERRQTT